MYVPDFCTSETEFLASESVRMNRYVGPRCDFVFKLLQVLHCLKLQWLLFSMTERDRSIQRPHFGFTHPKKVTPIRRSDISHGLSNLLILRRLSTYPLRRRRNYDSRSQNDVRDHSRHGADDSVWWIFSADLFDEQGQRIHG